jgi:hypothetical protein
MEYSRYEGPRARIIFWSPISKTIFPSRSGKKIGEEDLLSSPMLHILMHKLELPVSKGVHILARLLHEGEKLVEFV